MDNPPSVPPTPLTFRKAAQYIGTKFGVTVSRQTVWNWAKTGINQKKLRSIKIGSRYFTTARWVSEFLQNDDAALHRLQRG